MGGQVTGGQVCGVRDVFAFGAANYSHARIPDDCLWMLLMDSGFITADEGEAQDYKDTFKTIAGVNMLEQTHSSIGDRGIVALGKELETNTKLKLLFLWGNGIGPAGGEALGEALKVNSVMTQLYLQENVLGDAGTINLARGLAVNSGLKKLYLAGNKVGDAGVNALLDALTTNTELAGLDLGEGDVQEKDVKAIETALEGSTDPVLRPDKILRARLAFPCAGYSRKTHCNSRGDPTVRKTGWLTIVKSAVARALYGPKDDAPKCVCTNCEEGYYGNQCEQGGFGSKKTTPPAVPTPAPTPAPTEAQQDTTNAKSEL
jgi:hypothetical protein